MGDEHLPKEALEQATDGEVELPAVVQELIRHVVDLCPLCRAAWAESSQQDHPENPGEEGGVGGTVPVYSESFARALALVRDREPDLRRELEEAPELVAELRARPEIEQLSLLEGERFHTWGICDLLINESYRAAFHNPSAAEELARLALVLSRRLDPERYGRRFLEDVRALAWAYLGNARRVGSNLGGADEALAAARSFLEAGVGEPLVRAQVLNLEASLRRDLRRFDESISLLNEVIEIYQVAEDWHMAARTVVKKGLSFREDGQTEAALATLRQALPLIDAERDPRLVLCARHNIVYSLLDIDRTREAADLLEEIRPLYAAFDDFSTRLRLRWIEGKVAAGLGRLDEAEAAFLETRRGFIEHGIGYDAALVSLDLALLYAEADRTADVRRLAGEMLPIFRSRDVHREALAALLVFQQAAISEALTTTLATEIATYLHRARRNPNLRFREEVVEEEGSALRDPDDAR